MERYNPWWVRERDFVYENWLSSEIKWKPEILHRISLKPFSLNFIYGPRQVGKTTLIKILINEILLRAHDPKSIFYYSCDELTDFRELGEVIDNYISIRKAWGIRNTYILLDEITFVDEWWRAIKSRIDRGEFDNDVLIITGSASMELMKHREYFPGRRGNGGDYTLLPLTFSQFIRKVEKINVSVGSFSEVEKNMAKNRIYEDRIKESFTRYIKTGGFPLSIKDYYAHGKVTGETLTTYLNWVRNDWIRAGKSEKYMKEVLSYILRAKGTPISWNGISSETGINSPHTAKSYVEVLEELFLVKILYFITPDLRVMYRKNRKIHFIDPLLYHIFSAYTGVKEDMGEIIEGTVASILSRTCEIYFWKNTTEVDVLCKNGDSLTGVEVTKGIKKWRKPRFLRKAYLLDRENLHLFLSAIG